MRDNRWTLEVWNEPLVVRVDVVVVSSFSFFGASRGFVVVTILAKFLPLAIVSLCDAGTGATRLLCVSNCSQKEFICHRPSVIKTV